MAVDLFAVVAVGISSSCNHRRLPRALVGCGRACVDPQPACCPCRLPLPCQPKRDAPDVLRAPVDAAADCMALPSKPGLSHPHSRAKSPTEVEQLQAKALHAFAQRPARLAKACGAPAVAPTFAYCFVTRPARRQQPPARFVGQQCAHPDIGSVAKLPPLTQPTIQEGRRAPELLPSCAGPLAAARPACDLCLFEGAGARVARPRGALNPPPQSPNRASRAEGGAARPPRAGTTRPHAHAPALFVSEGCGHPSLTARRPVWRFPAIIMCACVWGAHQCCGSVPLRQPRSGVAARAV